MLFLFLACVIAASMQCNNYCRFYAWLHFLIFLTCTSSYNNSQLRCCFVTVLKWRRDCERGHVSCVNDLLCIVATSVSAKRCWLFWEIFINLKSSATSCWNAIVFRGKEIKILFTLTLCSVYQTKSRCSCWALHSNLLLFLIVQKEYQKQADLRFYKIRQHVVSYGVLCGWSDW